MSIPLAAILGTITANGTTPILAAGNYALTDIEINAWETVALAAGASGAYFQLMSGASPITGVAGFAYVAAASAIIIPNGISRRSFPSPLILPRGNTITLLTTSLGNSSQVNVLINLSGYSLL